MSNFNSLSSCTVEFTEEESKILTKASEILSEAGKDIWQNGDHTDAEDEVSFFLSDLGGGIENLLKGNYFTP